MSTEKEAFEYTYSAVQQDEVKKIREKYLPSEIKEEEDRMDKLRRLDESVTKKGSVISLVVGILSAIIMGAGMSLVMTDLGVSLGLGGISAMIIGIVIGVIGLAGAAMAYPLYTVITNKERERIAPEILRLTDELMK